jgi:hypothetical protein
MPTTTISTCVSFTFYSSPVTSYDGANTVDPRTRPSSPISISTDDGSVRPYSPRISGPDQADILSEVGYTIVDDPCLDINHIPASTIPPATSLRPRVTFGQTSVADSLTMAAGTASSSADHTAVDAAVTIALAPTTTPAAIPAPAATPVATVATPAATTLSITSAAAAVDVGAPHSDERWYCVTVGKDVGVFQGV